MTDECGNDFIVAAAVRYRYCHGRLFFRRNRYDEVIFRICSDDMPLTVFEGAIHIIRGGGGYEDKSD